MVSRSQHNAIARVHGYNSRMILDPTSHTREFTRRHPHTLGCWVVLMLAFVDGVRGDERETLPRLPAGTVVAVSKSERWNRVVLVSQPQLTSGDVDAVAASIRESASTLWLAIMATVVREQRDDGAGKYRLLEVGVGTSVVIDGQLRVLTLDNASELGVSLGLVKRQQLIENDRQFEQLRLVAQTSTLVIFDAPAIMHRQGQHVDRIMRHLVWIDSRTGAQAAMVWLLEERDGGWIVSDEPARWLKPTTKEQRQIHIDRDEFTLGFPGRQAFALEDLPPGTDIEWEEQVKPLAARKSYSMEEIRQLSAGLNRSLQTARE